MIRENPINFRFKIAVVGEENSGKTSLVHCFAEQSMSRTLMGRNDVLMKTLRLRSGELVELKLWDTVESSRRSLTPFHYRGADGVVITYDATIPNPVLNVREWLKEVKLHTKGTDVVIFVAATKCDLQYKNMQGIEAVRKQLAEKADSFFETSTSKEEHVQNLFRTMAEMLVARRVLGFDRSSKMHSIIIGHDDDNFQTGANEQSRKCCS